MTQINHKPLLPNAIGKKVPQQLIENVKKNNAIGLRGVLVEKNGDKNNQSNQMHNNNDNNDNNNNNNYDQYDDLNRISYTQDDLSSGSVHNLPHEYQLQQLQQQERQNNPENYDQNEQNEIMVEKSQKSPPPPILHQLSTTDNTSLQETNLGYPKSRQLLKQRSIKTLSPQLQPNDPNSTRNNQKTAQIGYHTSRLTTLPSPSNSTQHQTQLQQFGPYTGQFNGKKGISQYNELNNFVLSPPHRLISQKSHQQSSQLHQYNNYNNNLMYLPQNDSNYRNNYINSINSVQNSSVETSTDLINPPSLQKQRELMIQPTPKQMEEILRYQNEQIELINSTKSSIGFNTTHGWYYTHHNSFYKLYIYELITLAQQESRLIKEYYDLTHCFVNKIGRTKWYQNKNINFQQQTNLIQNNLNNPSSRQINMTNTSQIPYPFNLQLFYNDKMMLTKQLGQFFQKLTKMYQHNTYSPLLTPTMNKYYNILNSLRQSIPFHMQISPYFSSLSSFQSHTNTQLHQYNTSLQLYNQNLSTRQPEQQFISNFALTDPLFHRYVTFMTITSENSLFVYFGGMKLFVLYNLDGGQYHPSSHFVWKLPNITAMAYSYENSHNFYNTNHIHPLIMSSENQNPAYRANFGYLLDPYNYHHEGTIQQIHKPLYGNKNVENFDQKNQNNFNFNDKNNTNNNNNNNNNKDGNLLNDKNNNFNENFNDENNFNDKNNQNIFFEESNLNNERLQRVVLDSYNHLDDTYVLNDDNTVFIPERVYSEQLNYFNNSRQMNSNFFEKNSNSAQNNSNFDDKNNDKNLINNPQYPSSFNPNTNPHTFLGQLDIKKEDNIWDDPSLLLSSDQFAIKIDKYQNPAQNGQFFTQNTQNLTQNYDTNSFKSDHDLIGDLDDELASLVPGLRTSRGQSIHQNDPNSTQNLQNSTKNINSRQSPLQNPSNPAQISPNDQIDDNNVNSNRKNDVDFESSERKWRYRSLFVELERTILKKKQKLQHFLDSHTHSLLSQSQQRSNNGGNTGRHGGQQFNTGFRGNNSNLAQSTLNYSQITPQHQQTRQNINQQRDLLNSSQINKNKHNFKNPQNQNFSPNFGQNNQNNILPPPPIVEPVKNDVLIIGLVDGTIVIFDCVQMKPINKFALSTPIITDITVGVQTNENNENNENNEKIENNNQNNNQKNNPKNSPSQQSVSYVQPISTIDNNTIQAPITAITTTPGDNHIIIVDSFGGIKLLGRNQIFLADFAINVANSEGAAVFF
jgi:hypothetical protein